MTLNEFMRQHYTWGWNITIIENLPHHEKEIFNSDISRKYDSYDFAGYQISNIQFEATESIFDDVTAVIRVYQMY